MNDQDKAKLDAALREVAEIVSKAPDGDIPELLGDGILDELMQAIAKPKAAGQGTPYEYLLDNKNRLQLLALLRHGITWNYSVKGKVESTTVYVSPSHIQWYPEGVMFTQGRQPFEGPIGLFEGGEVKFAIAKRDMKGPERMGKDDFLFVGVNEAQVRSHQPTVPGTVEELDQTLRGLNEMLDQGEPDEKRYQDFFMAHPWLFGAQYTRIDSHKAFDDENIPDFTGVRVRDAARDIIEIKPPTLPLFQQSDEPRAEFNSAWNQAERYLDFARREADYLHRQKGLRFDNPHCFLLAGHSLTASQIKVIRLKERLNPAITVLTYNDVLALATATVEFIKGLRGQEGFEQAAGAYEEPADGSLEAQP
jgi:hypothetical protein